MSAKGRHDCPMGRTMAGCDWRDTLEGERKNSGELEEAREDNEVSQAGGARSLESRRTIGYKKAETIVGWLYTYDPTGRT